MFPGHPWEGEEFGPIEYEWYLRRGYELDILFDVNMKPFIEFCKEGDHRSNQLAMKIAARLSTDHLPQYLLALNRKFYPARYPAGYVRPIRPGGDMLEHIAVREKEEYFVERNVRDNMQPLVKFFANKAPRAGLFLSRTIFASRETKDGFALLVSRNPLKSLNTKIVFWGANYRHMVLAIPYGDTVTCAFGAPHAFGNINFYEPFLMKFKTYMEDPDQIPTDILEKGYHADPPKE